MRPATKDNPLPVSTALLSHELGGADRAKTLTARSRYSNGRMHPMKDPVLTCDIGSSIGNVALSADEA